MLITDTFLAVGLLFGSAGKEFACNMGDLGSIPGLGSSLGEEKGYQLQYSGLENSMDCIVHGVAKSWTRLSNFAFSLFLQYQRSVFIPIPKKGNAKECSNYHTIALISHANKVTLEILQARFQQYVSCEIPDVKAGFRKGRGTPNQIANICWIVEKARGFLKNIYFCFID